MFGQIWPPLGLMLTFSFALCMRAYPDHDLWLVHTLDAPELSAAGHTRAQALEKLHDALQDLLGRTHPNQLWRIAKQPKAWQQTRATLPLYLVEPDPWARDASLAPADDARTWVSMELPLLWKSLVKGVRLEHLPSHVQTLVTLEDDLEHRSWRTFMRSLDRANDLGLGAITWEVELLGLEVSFDPLDLTDIPADKLWQPSFEPEMLQALARAKTGPTTPVLEAVAQCWSRLGEEERKEAKIEPSFGRKLELHILRELVFGAGMAAPAVVVGRARVGKTALIKHLVWDGVHPPGSERQVWFAPPPKLCATDPFSPGWQQQCQLLCHELEQTGDVLYVGRLIEALDAGKFVGSEYNLAQFLKPWLSDRRIRMVAEATAEEWASIERRDAGFARAFEVVRLEDPVDYSHTYRSIILPGAQRLAARSGITLAPKAIERAWMLQRRFGDDSSPIGATLNLLRNALGRAHRAYRSHVTLDDLIDLFCARTGLPSFMLRDEETLDLGQVAATLNAQVRGQEGAVAQVARVIGITKAGLSEPDRPLGSFLFVGPTGVGKTELARSIARFLFGHTDRLVRLDMSEYSGPDAYGRLIGEGAQDEGGEMPVGDLTGPVRLYPFCVVLLDEIEKAHASVFDLLLQVLGEARLSDTQGRTTRFQNTLIILTSNLGVESWKSSMGFGEALAMARDQDSWKGHFRREAERFFRPEFLARIDQFVPFAPLGEEVLVRIAIDQVQAVLGRHGLERSEAMVHLDVDLVARWIVRQSWDPQYGARHLKSAISRHLALPVARALAAHDPQVGGVTLHIQAPPGAQRLHLEASVWSKGSGAMPVTKRNLLEQIDEIATLRRQLQRRRTSDLFAELQWEVEQFDLFSQAEAFWQDADAAEFATKAEHARRLIEPFDAMMGELEGLEDLANESYHTQVFDIHEDIQERLEQLKPGARELMLLVLRTAFTLPDRIALVLPHKAGAESWRMQLVRWYEALAELYRWQLQLWRANPEAPRAHDQGQERDDAWLPLPLSHLPKTQGSPMLLLEFEGLAARPLLQHEHGLHRLVDSDHNAVAQVVVLHEYGLQRPHPDEVQTDGATQVVRVWNRRTAEVSIPYASSLPFEEGGPWKQVIPALEEQAWAWLDHRGD